MSETTDLPCVYGEQILKDCPVQIFLLQPDIQRYQATSDPAGAVQQARLIGEILKSANSMVFISLAAFCASCPHIHAFKQRELKK